MAINYLNSINLNKNELIQAQIENQANDTAAGTGVEGQLYYNTTDDVLKVWSDGSWSEVGGGVITLTAGTYLTDTGTAEDPIINHDDTSRSDSTSTDSPGYGASFDVVDSVTSNATGHVTAINVKTVTLPASDDTTYKIHVESGLANSATLALIPDEEIVPVSSTSIIGTTNEISISETTGPAGSITIGLPDDVTITDSLTVSGIGSFGSWLDMQGNAITDLAAPTAGTDAATKQYVDDSVAGGLVYQGGYDASTNTPNLDTPPTGTINKGFTYTVTEDGTFFTEQVRVGDVLIAEIDNPTTLADWTTVQNNVDLADASTVGIGNVAAGTGISVAYSAGTATVTNTDTNSSNTATGTITAGQLSGTVTHTFGVNTIVQTIDSSGTTVFCDITRTATTSVATITEAQAGDITILVQKIG